MNNLSDKLTSLWEKLKKIKHIQIYLALFVAFIVLAFYFVSLPKDEKQTSTNNNQNFETFSTSAEYICYLENKLESVLGGIKGAGSVDIVITLDKGFEYVYATEEEIKSLTNGGSVTTSKVILVDGKPVLEKELFPSIKGIVVVCKGAEDVTVRLNLLSAIQTVVDVDNSKIIILAGN